MCYDFVEGLSGVLIKKANLWTVSLAVSLFLIGMGFQNCARFTFEGKDRKQNQSASIASPGGDSYDGKTYINYDLEGQCLNSSNGDLKIKYRLQKSNDTYQIEKGDCELAPGDHVIGSVTIPTSGQVAVDTITSPVSFKPFNGKVIVMAGQVFQLPKEDINDELIETLVRGDMDSNSSEIRYFDLEVFRGAGGSSGFRYLVGEHNLQNGQEVQTGGTVVRVADSFNRQLNNNEIQILADFGPGSVEVTTDGAGSSGAVTSSGDIGVDGGLSDSSVEVSQTDLCVSGTAPIGTQCKSGAIYAGVIMGRNMMITPGNCTDSTTPTCDGGLDTMTKSWSGTGGVDTDIPGVESIGLNTTANLLSTVNGDVNTAAIVASGFNGPDSAARYCDEMVFAGYDDWFLPAKSEMSQIYCFANTTGHNATMPQEDPDCGSFGGKSYILEGFTGGWYWTSTETSAGTGWNVSFTSGSNAGNIKGAQNPFRCVRSF